MAFSHLKVMIWISIMEGLAVSLKTRFWRLPRFVIYNARSKATSEILED